MKREGLLSGEEFHILAALTGEVPCLALRGGRPDMGGVVLSRAVPCGKGMCALHFAH